jgi:uncharacterized integral membrane protein
LALRRALKIIVLVPVAIVLVALAVANREPVRFALDPFDAGATGLALTMPLFWIVFAALALGVVIGGVAVWLRQGRFRRAARREHEDAVRWRQEVARRRSTVAALPPAQRPAA